MRATLGGRNLDGNASWQVDLGVPGKWKVGVAVEKRVVRSNSF